MAGEIQLNGTTALTESGGEVILNNVDSATNRTNLGLGSAATSASTAFASSSTTVTAGTGLSGGGDLSTNRTINVSFSANESNVKTALNASGSAPIYACRAWINFDGTSASIGTGRANGNVSGVTDNGTGNYTITFSTAMPDANYCAVAINDLSSNGAWYVVSYMTNLTTTNVQYRNNSHYDSNLNPADCATISCCVLR